MSGLFGAQNQQQYYVGLQIQSSVSTLPIPIVWGMNKLPGNLVWYANFQYHPTNQSGGGGKGGGSSNGSSGPVYTADVILAVCEGPVTGVNTIYAGQTIYSLTGPDAVGFGMQLGTTPQAAWPYLVSTYGYPQDLAYQGTAYFFAPSVPLTSSATVDQYNFEILGFRYGTGYGQRLYTQSGVALLNGSYSPAPATGYFDADPALVIWDFLTNAQYGVGLPTSSIDQTTLFTQGGGNDASVQTYCRALGLAFSPVLNSQEQASEILKRWLQLLNVGAVWSNGTLRFIPYGDTTVVGNGITFQPDVTPIYNLGDDDYVVEKDQDPLQVSVSDLYEAYNVWRLEYANRNNPFNTQIGPQQYALTPCELRDQNAIELVAEATGTNGIRLAPTVAAHEICDEAVAAISGQLMLQRAVYIRNTYKLTLSWEYCLLDPMDLVTVTDSILGLSNTAIRITEIAEDENGQLAITAEEFPQGVATATLYPTATGSGATVNRNQQVGSVNAPVIFEPTDELGGGLQIWAAVSCPNALYGGCNVLVSTSATGNFSWVGTLSGSSNMGVTTADLPAVAENPVATTIDSLNTLAVDLTSSNGALAAASPNDIATLDNPCYVGGEIVCFGASALTAAHKYSLTDLARGVYGSESAIADHPTGSAFARLDNVFKYPFGQGAIGQTLYFKFQSFNAWGGGMQSIADCAAYPYTVTGSALLSPLPNVTDVYSNYEAGFQKIYWDQVTDFRSGIVYEIRLGLSWATALLQRVQAHPPFIASGNGTYWVSARCQPVAGGPIVYSEDPVSIVISGNQLSLTYAESFDEIATLLSGSLDYGLSGAGTSALSLSLSLNTKATAAAASGNQVNVVSLPSIVGYGFAISDTTTSAALPTGAFVQSVNAYNSADDGPLELTNAMTLATVDYGSITASPTSTIDDGAITDTVATLTLSANVTSGGVLSGDTLALNGVPLNTAFYYEPPNSHWLTSAYLANGAINASAGFAGVVFGANFLAIGDFLNDPDILGLTETSFIDGWIEIATATNKPVLPVPQWSAWQQFVPGVFPATAWKLRIGMMSTSPAAEPQCTAFSFAGQLPTRTDNYVNESVGSGGLAITFTPDGSVTAQPFNSGVNGAALPRVQVDWQATSGDTYTLTNFTLAGLTITFFNGGSPVARTATIVVQGA